MELIAALVFVFVVLGLALLLKSIPGASKARYEAVPVLTPAETNFYRSLVLALDRSTFLICPKVRLADVIAPHSSLRGKAHYAAFGKTKSKHLDFVILRANTLQTYGVIELDDSSHNLPKRSERDRFVDGALTGAGIPILRLKPQRAYDVASLRLQITKAFVPIPGASPAGGMPALFRR